MHPDDFWHGYTLAEILIRTHHFYKRENEAYKDRWEQTRMLAYYQVVVQTSSKKTIKVTDVMRFPWDDIESKPKEPELMTRDEADRIMKIHGLK